MESEGVARLGGVLDVSWSILGRLWCRDNILERPVAILEASGGVLARKRWPTWLHFGTQNPIKSSQKSIPRGIKFLIDFCIDFFFILAPSWHPSWGHVGHLFRAKTPPRRPKTSPEQPQDTPRRPQNTPRRPKTLRDPPRRPQSAQNHPWTTILG